MQEDACGAAFERRRPGLGLSSGQEHSLAIACCDEGRSWVDVLVGTVMFSNVDSTPDLLNYLAG